jgi:FtsH-binding integral membrane protein
MFVATIIALGACYAKRKSYPVNLVALCVFTGLQAVSVGSITVFYSANIVLNAWISATFVFIGLSLFALQTKKDFTGMYPFLSACLMVLLITGLMQLFLPYNSWTDVMIAFFTGILFAAYVVGTIFSILSLSRLWRT